MTPTGADGWRREAERDPAPAHEVEAHDDVIALAIERFQRGHAREAAFRLIYETYYHPLQRFFARKGLAAEDCRDLTQETFLWIYKSLAGYQENQRFVGWLYRVATTTFLKWRRSATAGKRAGVEVSRDAMADPDAVGMAPGRQLEVLLDGERQRLILAAVAELPEQMRHCLTLRLCRQLAYREIAVIKGISIETVKAHLFRARKKLETQLGDLGLGDFE